MKKIFPTIVLSLLVTACAGVAQFQANCYREYPKFKDAYSCILSQMEKDYRFNSPAYAGLISEYQITAEVLQDKVEKGKMTNAEAKLALAQKRAELSSRENGYNTVTSSSSMSY